MENVVDYEHAKIVSKRPMYLELVILPSTPLGVSKSIPAGTTTVLPQISIKSVNPKEHPQVMSTVTGPYLKPLEPENTSNLVQ